MKRLMMLSLLCVMLFCTAFPLISAVAGADAVTVNSTVIDDLSRDPAFDASLYPSSTTGRDLSIITIAESLEKELILYVYQPYVRSTYYATSVRMSTQVDEDTFVNTTDYTLKCLGHNGVFYKYVVNGYTVSSDEVRNYNIIQLMRNYVQGIDTPSIYDETINAVPYVVGKQFTFQVVDGVLTNTERGIDVVKITDKYVGFVRIESYVESTVGMMNGSYYLMQDSHFIAFNCDHPMDRLLEAKVSFFKEYVHKYWGETSFSPAIGGKQIKYLRDDVTVSVEKDFGNGWGMLSHKLNVAAGIDLGDDLYNWNEIQTVDAFFDSTNRETIYQGLVSNTHVYNKITPQNESVMREMTWVLNYAQTRSTFKPAFYDFGSFDYTAATAECDFEQITNATILELCFVHGGKTYQLGVVDGESTPSETPVNEYGKERKSRFSDESDDLGKFFKALALVGGLLAMSVVVLSILYCVIRAKKNKEDNDNGRQ